MLNYQQRDGHSCAFVAALTVAKFFDDIIDPDEVFEALHPTTNGLDRDGLVSGLNNLGITAKYRDDLELADLLAHIQNNIPMVLTIMGEWSSVDHWTIVEGFSADGSEIHLSNYGSLPVVRFLRDWYDMGEGLVCKKRLQPT